MVRRKTVTCCIFVRIGFQPSKSIADVTGGVVNSGGVVVGREVDAVEMDAVEMNRLSWNAATVAHNSHKGDQAQFFRNGGSTLFPEEVALLGEIDGSSILHLQCNSGQDSLSLAALGAAVTGVDISDSAIDFARTLSAESGIAADFERADVSAWLRDAGATGRKFDRVFSSYGTVIWLPDLDEWAEGIAGVLAPNGRFVLVEFHPFAMCFDEKWSLTYPYGGGTPVTEPGGVGDYVADSADLVLPGAQGDGVENFENPFPSCEFNWSIAEVLGALRRAGLTLESFDEYPYANGWQGFEEMAELGGKRWGVPAGRPEIPLMYSLSVRLAD